jgi:hypothetical protein
VPSAALVAGLLLTHWHAESFYLGVVFKQEMFLAIHLAIG